MKCIAAPATARVFCSSLDRSVIRQTKRSLGVKRSEIESSSRIRPRRAGSLNISPETGALSSPKNSPKTKKEGPETRRDDEEVDSATKVCVLPMTEFGSHPCADPTAAAKMESVKAQKKQGPRGCGLDCESSAGLHSRRADRSRECGSRFVKCLAE